MSEEIIDGSKLFSSNEDIAKILFEEVKFFPPPVLDTFAHQCYFAYQLCHPDLTKMILGAKAQAVQIAIVHPASGYMVGDIYNYVQNKDISFEVFRENMVKKLKQRVEENSNV